ncbi:MAG TPA: type II toxin-antitoxin system PemK/MazF family toxin [Ilumatobacteraceae bacterium]|nr:type II toxin-antitoxin system PemK/MazF family toxin [Ilumatobacteraceae bacterium]
MASKIGAVFQRLLSGTRQAARATRDQHDERTSTGGSSRRTKRQKSTAQPTPKAPAKPDAKQESRPQPKPGVPPPTSGTGQPRGADESTSSRNGVPGAPSRSTSLAGARIEYNPDLDGDADPGEVVWTWVPYEEDATQGKDRPVLIVGRRNGWLIGVMLTSKAHDGDPDHVSVGTGAWDRDGRVSYAKLDRVLEVDAGQVRREGAILPRARFDAVIAELLAS